MGKAGNQSSTPPWLEYKKRLTEAWKKKPPQSGLAILIQQLDVPIKVVAEVLRREYPRRRVGRPAGRRWESPHYVVAYMVKRTSPRQAPHMITDEFISRWIEDINGWAFMRGKSPLDPEPGSREHERVPRLL
jgi:hypothetical protein